MGELSKLKGLGPKSEQQLNRIGIYTRQDLVKIGPINAYLKLKREASIKPSLNFLYAMVGALAGKDWTDIAHTERSRLLIELDGYKELEDLIKTDADPVR
ncbi:MAG: TfoX/Sxy family protein [Gammaproteobacteria bacterium]|nr:TfoX/Sxy family protein [Gammaproteobacteria bacterium]